MELTLPASTDCAFGYTSCIKINGRPILPPLMTDSRRQEMAEYRRQAAIAETRILRRKIERAHQLWEKRNDRLTLTSTVYNTKESEKYGRDENISDFQHCKANGKAFVIPKVQISYADHSLPNVSSHMLYETEHSNSCDLNQQNFINPQNLNCCDPIDHQFAAINEMPFSSVHNISSKLLSIHKEQNRAEREHELSASRQSCDNSIAIAEENNDTIVEVKETSFETDTDSVALSVEQSTDLEKYLDSSPPAAHSAIGNSAIQFNEKSSDSRCILKCNSSSLDTTICPSLEDSVETLVPSVHEECNKEEKGCVGLIHDSKHEFNLVSDDLISEGDTTNTTRCHVRRSSYTLDEPSPALMLAMEDSHHSEIDSPSNFFSSPFITEEHKSNISHVMPQNYEVKDICSSPHTQNNLDSEMADINSVSACSIDDKQETDILKAIESGNNSNQSMLLDNQNIHEVSCSREQAILMMTMKNTMEKLFKEQERNFENARKRLSDLHHQQMEKLLADQSQEWQHLLEEADNEFEQIPSQNQAIEPSESKNADCSGLNNKKVEYNTNKDVKIEVSTLKDHSENIISSDNEAKTKEITSDMQLKFNKVSAVAKGFLTRRLMKSERVQRIIQTIKDTLICAMRFHQEVPIKKGQVTEKDAELHKRLITQLTAACHELHDIFFKLTVKEKMEIIRQTREKMKKNLADANDSLNNKKYISDATLKVLERKKMNKSPATISDTMERKKLPAKYSFKTLKSSDNSSNLLKLPSRRGNAPVVRPSHSPPVRKYARQTSPKQDFQKASRKPTPARKRLLETSVIQKR